MTYLEGGESLIDWGPWVDDIMAAAAVVQELWDKLKEFAAWVWERLDFTEVWEGLKTSLGGVKDAILGAFGYLKGLFSGDMGEMQAGLEKCWNGIITFFEGQGQVLLSVVKNILNLIGDAFGVDLAPLIKVIEDVFGELITTARNLIEPLVEIVGSVVEGVSALLRGDFSGAVEAAGNIVQSVFDGIKAVVLGAIGIFEKLLTFILNVFGVDVEVSLGHLKDFVELVFSGITKAIDIAKDVIDVAVKIITGIIGGLIGILKDAWNWVKKVTGLGQSEEEKKADFEDRALKEKFTKRESYDAGGGVYAEAVTFDEEGYKKAKAELDAKRAAEAESGKTTENQSTPAPGQTTVSPDVNNSMPSEPQHQSQHQPAPTQSPDSSNVDVEKPLLNAKNIDVESPPLISEATKAGKVETNVKNIQQTNNINTDVNIAVTGSNDPEETADRVYMKQDDVVRNLASCVSSTTGSLE
jgi:hypothetical protein